MQQIIIKCSLKFKSYVIVKSSIFDFRMIITQRTDIKDFFKGK